MKFLIDMNFSPDWVDFLTQEGYEALHWSQVRNPRAPDTEIFSFAVANNYIVLTHDLDFGAILAATNANAPSVVQARTQNTLPEKLGPRLLKAILQFQHLLEKGALLTLNEMTEKIRVLPLK